MQRTRIGAVSALALIVTALLFDMAQFFVAFIPFVNVVLGFFLGVLALIIFAGWFGIFLHVNYFQGKQAAGKIAALLGTAVVELVPLVDALPAITMGVLTIILLTWSEDRSDTSAVRAQAQQLSAAAQARSQLQQQQAAQLARRAGMLQPETEQQQLARAQERQEARRAAALERFGYTPPESGAP